MEETPNNKKSKRPVNTNTTKDNRLSDKDINQITATKIIYSNANELHKFFESNKDNTKEFIIKEIAKNLNNIKKQDIILFELESVMYNNSNIVLNLPRTEWVNALEDIRKYYESKLESINAQQTDFEKCTEIRELIKKLNRKINKNNKLKKEK
jgi:vacuolar-type H+-ATPase subunit I/STV1